MPYKSAKQRAFMHAKHPEIAARWDRETGGKIVPTKGKSNGGKAKPQSKARSGRKVRGR